LLGALLGAARVVEFTQLVNMSVGVVSSQATWALIVLPLLGSALSCWCSTGSDGARARGSSLRQRVQQERAAMSVREWRTFPRGVARSDLTGEMVTVAGARPLRDEAVASQ
jgi:hypothetical protein